MMIKDSYNYCEVICNYLNNLKGYIEKEEIESLLWSVFGIPNEDINEDLVTNEDILKLSADVECGRDKDFYEDLYAIYKRIGVN